MVAVCAASAGCGRSDASPTLVSASLVWAIPTVSAPAARDAVNWSKAPTEWDFAIQHETAVEGWTYAGAEP